MWTTTDPVDGSYSCKYNFKWLTPLFSQDIQPLQYKWLWSFYLMKMMVIFIQAITLIPMLGALHVLSCLSCTTTLQVTSYFSHFAKEKIEA